MAVGANLKYAVQNQLWSEFWRLLSQKRTGKQKVKQKICYKVGVPANNTAADNPNALYDICIDTSNGRIYLCTAFTTDASATTWTRIV